MSKVLRCKLTASGEPLAREAARLLARELRERADVEVLPVEEAPDLILGIEPGVQAGGYRIASAGAACCVAGGDPAGLLYGVGRNFHNTILTPPAPAFAATPVPDPEPARQHRPPGLSQHGRGLRPAGACFTCVRPLIRRRLPARTSLAWSRTGRTPVSLN